MNNNKAQNEIDALKERIYQEMKSIEAVRQHGAIAVTIHCTGEEIEHANFVLGQACRTANIKAEYSDSVILAESFRTKMLDAYLMLSANNQQQKIK